MAERHRVIVVLCVGFFGRRSNRKISKNTPKSQENPFYFTSHQQHSNSASELLIGFARSKITADPTDPP